MSFLTLIAPTLWRLCQTHWRTSVFLALLVPVSIVFIATGWFGDDAFITFRTVDNITQGWGPRWNVGERSQGYTHPLWMLLHVPLYAITGQITLSSVILSAGCILGAFWMLSHKIAKTPWGLACGGILCLSSRSFTDYMQSGLENPLTFLMIAVFVALFLGPEDHEHPDQHQPKLWMLSLVIGMAMFNRMDTLLLLAPGMLWQTFGAERPTWRRLAQASVGLGVIGSWVVFSVIYYGVPLPNTAYAKLGTGIAGWELALHSAKYFRYSLKLDPVALPAIAAIFALIWMVGTKRSRWMMLGMPLYLLYVVKIGGDFMAMRFFGAPFFLGVCLATRVPLSLNRRTAILPLVFIFMSLLGSYPVLTLDERFTTSYRERIGPDGITDERRFYAKRTAIWRPGVLLRKKPFQFFDRRTAGRRIAQESLRQTQGDQGRHVMIHGHVGFLGYYSGEPIHIIDYNALTDPLLSKLPAIYRSNWTLGHYGRHVPKGYLESIKTGENKIEDPNIRELYAHMKRITQDPLWSVDRWCSIWWLNTGLLRHLIVQDKWYFKRAKQTSRKQLLKPKKDGASWRKDTVRLGRTGIKLDYDEVQHPTWIDFSSDAGDGLKIFFVRQGEIVHAEDFGAKLQHGLLRRQWRLPKELRKQGFDGVRMFYLHNDGAASVGHFILWEQPEVKG